MAAFVLMAVSAYSDEEEDDCTDDDDEAGCRERNASSSSSETRSSRTVLLRCSVAVGVGLPAQELACYLVA